MTIAKIVFAGCSNVGKTSIVYRYDHNKLQDMGPTIGACFVRKHMVKNNESIMLDIWDTAGQERYYSISTHYFRNALYCILVFDVTDIRSFEKINIWKKICEEAQQNKVVYFLVGNKIDKDSRTVTPDEIDAYCKQHGIYKYIETSALTGEGIKPLFDEIGNHIYNNKPNNPPQSIITPTISFKSSACQC